MIVLPCITSSIAVADAVRSCRAINSYVLCRTFQCSIKT